MTNWNAFFKNPSHDFARKKLNGLNLSGRDFRNCNFREATLNGADCIRTMFNGTNFENAEMRGMNLDNTTLCGANLYGADLSGSNLQYTDFSGAILEKSNFSNTDLTNINLDGAIVKNAKFIGCRGLNQEIADDLKRRGAIVEDKVSLNQKKRGKDVKWWVQYVFVPLLISLISSGSIITFIKGFENKSNSSEPFSHAESNKTK